MSDRRHPFYRRFRKWTRAECQRLSLWARLLASELLFWVDDDGCLYLGRCEDPAEAIVKIIAAQPEYAKRVAANVKELLADGYLVFDTTIGVIRFRDWQREEQSGGGTANV